MLVLRSSEGPVSELPVECPNLNVTVDVEPQTGNYVFTDPDFGSGDVTLLTGVTYFPHSSVYDMHFSITNDQILTAGIFEIATNICDSVLCKLCWSTLTVIGK